MTTINKAVIFDHTTLFDHNAETTDRLKQVIVKLQSLGVRVVVFSTNRIPIQARVRRHDYPPVDLYLDADAVGTKKGTTEWVAEVCGRLELASHQLLYVGDDAQDWREAINSGVFPVHAGWAKAEHPKAPITVASPRELYRFLSHFFLPDDRWECRLDLPAKGITLRSLLHPDTGLTRDGGLTFTPKDIFTYGRTHRVGGWKSPYLLMLHCLSNLYAEGLISAGCWFCVYPGHLAGTYSRVVAEFLEPAAKFFHGFFKADLLIRAVDAPDTSLARRDGVVLFTHQTNTVHIDPDYEKKVAGRTVVVFDDFTTDGMGLEWARLLLRAAGAGRVICMTAGKFGTNHREYRPRRGGLIRPFVQTEYGESDFTYQPHLVTQNRAGRETTCSMFSHWCEQKSFPLPVPA